MASENNKKLLLMYVLNILKEYSDADCPLTQQEIINRIGLVYGMSVERKAIASNIENLISLGFDIIQVNRKGYYLGQREFEPSEIQFLVDAVFSSKVINRRQSVALAKKLYSFLSKNERKKFNYVYKTESVSKSSNKQIFYNIEIISDAIERKKKISFKYNDYDINKQLVPRQNGKRYLVNPYFMVNNQGRYYLVCNYDLYEQIGNYKVDLITEIKLEEHPVKPATKLKDYSKGLDIAKYINENIYMFGGKTISATIKLKSTNDISTVVDWFGENSKLSEKNNEIFAEIKANEDALIYWALQYGESVEVIAPQETREKIKEKIESIKNQYKD